MSTTLTNGLKLPDKGSVDWYADMQSNYAILDGAVGTVAEHTTQIAGKAPAVHTHTKSDITDLFNSANAWTGDNTYSKTVAIERSTDTGTFLALKNTVAELGSTPASATPVTIAYRDKNNDNLGYMGVYYDTDGSNHFRLYVRNKFTSGAPSTTGSYDYAFFGLRLNADKSKEGIIKASFKPYDNNTHDLGSSSYQWNNLYAKNYYYNGVAWGLDKANVWSGSNSFNSGLTINDAALLNAVLQNAVKGDVSTTGDFAIFIKDKINGNAATSLLAVYRGGQDSGGSYAQISIDTKGYDNNRYNNSILFRINPADNSNNAILIPQRDKTIDLGTSTNKFKTLNGINPGALSLPKIVAKNTANIASAIVGSDGETQYLDGTDNYYTAALDGWISMCISGFTQDNQLWITVYDVRNETWGTSAESSTSARNTLFIIFPIRANQKMRIRMKCTSVDYARFYPCEGNV